MAARQELPSRVPGRATQSSDKEDDEAIRRLGERRNLLPTVAPSDSQPTPTAAPERAEPPSAGSVSAAPETPSRAKRERTYERPAPTEPLQLKLPDYLAAKLRDDAAKRQVTVKELVMEALEAAGYEIKDIDFRDLRRR